MTTTDLPIWAEVSLRLGRFLDGEMIADASASLLGLSCERAIVAGLMLLAAVRVVKALQVLPRRERGQSLVDYFQVPWWRMPALMVGLGTLGMSVLLLIQAISGPARLVEGTGDGGWTRYLFLMHVAQAMTAYGVAWAAGMLRGRLRA